MAEGVPAPFGEDGAGLVPPVEDGLDASTIKNEFTRQGGVVNVLTVLAVKRSPDSTAVWKCAERDAGGLDREKEATYASSSAWVVKGTKAETRASPL